MSNCITIGVYLIFLTHLISEHEGTIQSRILYSVMTDSAYFFVIKGCKQSSKINEDITILYCSKALDNIHNRKTFPTMTQVINQPLCVRIY